MKIYEDENEIAIMKKYIKLLYHYIKYYTTIQYYTFM
jgi:hypothetical protein